MLFTLFSNKLEPSQLESHYLVLGINPSTLCDIRVLQLKLLLLDVGVCERVDFFSFSLFLFILSILKVLFVPDKHISLKKKISSQFNILLEKYKHILMDSE